jgi:nucleotide-binding universal stress UspA family protein
VPYRKILVASDGSATAHKAVDRAVEVAAHTGADVTILTVGRPDRAGPIAAAEVERVAQSTDADGAAAAVTIATKTDDGDAAQIILDEAEQGRYDLLVVGNKGMTGAGRFLLGSVPNKISHHAPCALLIVRTT